MLGVKLYIVQMYGSIVLKNGVFFTDVIINVNGKLCSKNVDMRMTDTRFVMAISRLTCGINMCAIKSKVNTKN